MNIGIPLFMLRPQQMADVAVRAEALGFESVWVAEHLVFPAEIRSRYPYAQEGVPPINPATPLLDPLLVLMQVAARTQRIRLGTNVYILPLRHPIAVARMVTTLDVLSGGRVSFGVGLGWLEEEFRAVGIDFASRAGRGREAIRALRALWTEEVASFRGRYVAFEPVRFEPKPAQRPHPPILVGGESEAALRRAAALGDGWYGVGHTPESAGAQARRLRALLAEQGRADAPFDFTVSHGGGALTADDVRRYADAGITRVVSLPWRRAREADEALDRLAERVLR
ncbi:LLM class F420-dependent oxidoreductase [bacterium]|nr:LLM class F420-dependent oxidoreductase [bacterium]